MAETVHLYLKSNGSDIKGESTQTTQGREGSIECVEYEFKVDTAREAGSAMATGRRTYQPIRVVKRIDKSSPLLFKALTNNEEVEGQFKFFRPHPKDGKPQQFYTVAIKQGRIGNIRQYVPNTLDSENDSLAPLEEVTFVFHTISKTYTDGGVSHEDTWTGQK